MTLYRDYIVNEILSVVRVRSFSRSERWRLKVESSEARLGPIRAWRLPLEFLFAYIAYVIARNSGHQLRQSSTNPPTWGQLLGGLGTGESGSHFPILVVAYSIRSVALYIFWPVQSRLLQEDAWYGSRAKAAESSQEPAVGRQGVQEEPSWEWVEEAICWLISRQRNCSWENVRLSCRSTIFTTRDYEFMNRDGVRRGKQAAFIML